MAGTFEDTKAHTVIMISMMLRAFPVELRQEIAEAAIARAMLPPGEEDRHVLSMADIAAGAKVADALLGIRDKNKT
jgi:hypothetical protein